MRRMEVAQVVIREYTVKFEKFVNHISRLWTREAPSPAQNSHDEIQKTSVKIVQNRLAQDGYVAVHSVNHTPADLWVLNTETNELALIKIINNTEIPSEGDICGLYDLKGFIEEYNSCGFGKIDLFVVSVIMHHTDAPSISYKQI